MTKFTCKNQIFKGMLIMLSLMIALPGQVLFAQNANCTVEISKHKDRNHPELTKLNAIAKGESPITYMWSTGETTQFILVDAEGEYCVTITDGVGCTTNECVVVEGEKECEVEIEVVTNRPGTNTASWTLTAKGHGSEPFQYKWNTGDDTQSITVERPGEYCVILIDAEGCEAKACVRVGTPDKCGVEITKIRGGLGTNTSSLVLLANPKGAEPFTYEWSTGETTQRILVDAAGKYCVTITDANGCKADACVEVEDPSGGRCDVTIRKVELRLPGSNGVLLLANGNGQAPFTFEWSTGETGRAILVDKSGEYCVVMKDAAGCETKACVRIDLGQSGECDVQILERKIPGPLGGTLLIAMPRGKAPYTFKWNTGDVNRVIFADRPGEYCVRMEDATGCIAEACTRVGNTRPDMCDVEIIHRPSPTASGEYVLQAVAKGHAPFEYMWSTGETTQTIRVKGAGEYCVKIVDATGCTARACFEIRDTRCAVDIIAKRDPNHHLVYLHAQAKGEAPFKYRWSNGETTETIRVDEEGEYCVAIVDANGCEAKSCFTVKFGQHDRCAVRIKVERRDPNTNTYVLVAEGKGNEPISYHWNTGEKTQRILITEAGEYCVEIVTSDNCTARACVKWDGRHVPGLTSNPVEVNYTVYPNPVSEFVVLKRDQTTEDQTVRVMRRDGYVALQAVWPGEAMERQLDVQHLNPGTYFIQVISKDEVRTLPFFKQ
jgi:hypothetical protein